LPTVLKPYTGDETFDLSVEKPLWLMASIRDRALVGKHDTVGRSYICLDPRRFGDLLTHDLWMDLDSQGRILLRVSMEGEKDEIGFYFGRAFRSLKRAESDMIKIFVDKVGSVIKNGGRSTHPTALPDVTDDIPVTFSECGQVLNQADRKHGFVRLQPSSGKRQRILHIRSRRLLGRSANPTTTLGETKNTS
jgi:hypothetical protein